MVPRQIRDTFKPVPPRFAYSMVQNFRDARRVCPAQIRYLRAESQCEARSTPSCLGCGHRFHRPLVAHGSHLHWAGSRAFFAPMTLCAIETFSGAAVIADEYFFSHLKG